MLNTRILRGAGVWIMVLFFVVSIGCSGSDPDTKPNKPGETDTKPNNVNQQGTVPKINSDPDKGTSDKGAGGKIEQPRGGGDIQLVPANPKLEPAGIPPAPTG